MLPFRMNQPCTHGGFDSSSFSNNAIITTTLHLRKNMFSKEFIEIYNKALCILHYPLFKINNADFSLLTLISIFLILVFGRFLAKSFKRYINSLIDNPKHALKQETATMLSVLGYYTILTISVLFSINYAGVDLTSLTIIMSALSVGIGFGLQAIISNFVSGIVLLFEQSVKIGDYVDISSNGLVGKVTDIKMRYTSILTFDNIEVIVPNKTFIESNVINWTMSDRIKRLKIPFGVAYGTDTQTVDEVIIPAIMALEKDFIKNDEDKLPRCVMTSMGDSSVNFELWIWIRVGIKNQTPPGVTMNDILRTIYKALNEHNIQIPFPQRDVHIVSVPDSLERLSHV
jgi:small-conductance mechanosensitive channel